MYFLFSPPLSLSLQDLKVVVELMKEGWDEDPEARLTAANIACRIDSLTQPKIRISSANEKQSSDTHPAFESSTSSTHKSIHTSSSFSGQSNNQPVLMASPRRPVSRAPSETPPTILRSLRAHFRYSSLRFERQGMSAVNGLGRSPSEHFSHNFPRDSSHSVRGSRHESPDSLHAPAVPPSNEQSSDDVGIDKATGQPHQGGGGVVHSEEGDNTIAIDDNYA